MASPLDTVPIDDAVLMRPAAELVRRLALWRIGQARSEALELSASDAPEVLHDFRVAVRRLRSLVAAFREELRGSVGKRHRRKLRRIMKATGSGRDADVATAWVERTALELDNAHRQAAERMLSHLRQRAAGLDEEARQALSRRFIEVADNLTGSVSSFRVRLDGTNATPLQPFGTALAHQVSAGADALRERLVQATGEGDTETLHRARIAGKRVRYLLEPVKSLGPEIEVALDGFRRLQRRLGKLNDLENLGLEIATVAARSAAERARLVISTALADPDAETPTERELAGYVALARRAAEERATLYEAFAREWLGGAAQEFWRDLDAICDRLRP